MSTVIEQLHQEIDRIPPTLAQELLSFLVIRRQLQEISPAQPESDNRQDLSSKSDYLGRLLKNPIKVPGFVPFSREECHDRAGFR